MDARSTRVGGYAVAGLALFYLLVVGGAGGVAQLGHQVLADWPWLAAILAGFGTQVALFAELRRRQRLHRRHATGLATTGTMAATGTGAGASAIGLVACCAHHVADLGPIIGASGAAVFLTDYRLPIMATGLAVNALGVTLAATRLRHTPLPRQAAPCSAH